MTEFIDLLYSLIREYMELLEYTTRYGSDYRPTSTIRGGLRGRGRLTPTRDVDYNESKVLGYTLLNMQKWHIYKTPLAALIYNDRRNTTGSENSVGSFLKWGVDHGMPEGPRTRKSKPTMDEVLQNPDQERTVVPPLETLLLMIRGLFSENPEYKDIVLLENMRTQVSAQRNAFRRMMTDVLRNYNKKITYQSVDLEEMGIKASITTEMGTYKMSINDRDGIYESYYGTRSS